MRCNQLGIDLIKKFEGCKLHAYKDVVGIDTIGYGHIEGVQMGDEIDQDTADQYLVNDLERFEHGVSSLVTAPLTSNQFSALVCFSYNVGLGNFKSSTLLKIINNKEASYINYAADQFMRWAKAGGVDVPGLVRRRKAEQFLFLS
jgi:lysozyme